MIIRNFLHRLYPLQTLKLLLRPAEAVTPTIQLEKQDLVDSVRHVLEAVHAAQDNIAISKSLEEKLGFSLRKGPSSIEHAGHGVFLNGRCKPGQVVSFYPGTVYLPSEPILLVSIANSYILKCIDGIFIDGKATGLSARIYRSLYYRENWPGAIQTSDATWMSETPRNPLAIGQIVNNGTRAFSPNVQYQEVDLPSNFPIHLRQYLPNIHWSSTDPFSSYSRIVVLMATRHIYDGDELFSTYMDTVG
ncbi:hypothetical protein VTP01DRAFT_8754 [Rhizomucor pusillus]|uniref:uncharacterized protein n=1 Tax=Rhizomucor pusillus TaxID=4840 RepID=UPI003741FA2A